MVEVCPSCQSRSVGRVGTAVYYCWDCCVEFSRAPGGWQLFRLEDDGTPVRAGTVPTAPSSW